MGGHIKLSQFLTPTGRDTASGSTPLALICPHCRSCMQGHTLPAPHPLAPAHSDWQASPSALHCQPGALGSASCPRCPLLIQHRLEQVCTCHDRPPWCGPGRGTSYHSPDANSYTRLHVNHGRRAARGMSTAEGGRGRGGPVVQKQGVQGGGQPARAPSVVSVPRQAGKWTPRRGGCKLGRALRIDTLG